MSAHCHSDCASSAAPSQNPAYRKALWVALAVNAAMFAVELGAGLQSGSVSLLADSIDFFGDAANYGVSLAVLGLAAAWRSRAALLKAVCMAAFGVFVLARAGWVAWHINAAQTDSLAGTMGTVGLLALAANVGVALLLFRWRDGDANMRSVWLCTRNDAIGNIAVMGAALGVLGTGTRWPDLAVAAAMAVLALSGGVSVARQALRELRSPDQLSHSAHS